MPERITVTLSRSTAERFANYVGRYLPAIPSRHPHFDGQALAEVEDTVRTALDAPQPENSGQDWMQTSLATVLAHFESEADAADQLALQHAAGTEPRIRYRTERDTYRYVLKQIRSAQPAPGGEDGDTERQINLSLDDARLLVKANEQPEPDDAAEALRFSTEAGPIPAPDTEEGT